MDNFCYRESKCGRGQICDYDYGQYGGCVDCPEARSAQSCRDAGYCDFKAFNECIEVCAGGNNPDEVQWAPIEMCGS